MFNCDNWIENEILKTVIDIVDDAMEELYFKIFVKYNFSNKIQFNTLTISNPIKITDTRDLKILYALKKYSSTELKFKLDFTEKQIDLCILNNNNILKNINPNTETRFYLININTILNFLRRYAKKI